MVVDTIHVMDANETTSETFKNYAGAAFLIGMAVLTIGIGAGMISQSIKTLRKSPAPNFTDDLLNAIRKKTGTKNMDVAASAAEAAVEGLRRTVDDLLGGHSPVINQVTSDEPVLYYIKKSYKEEVKVGSMIPENFLVPKPDTMSMETFLSMDNTKFKSTVVSHIMGGMNLITVEEIVNSEPVKPV